MNILKALGITFAVLVLVALWLVFPWYLFGHVLALSEVPGLLSVAVWIMGWPLFLGILSEMDR